MHSVINTKLGENRGLPRIWIEGENISPAFQIGQHIEMKVDRRKRVVHLKRVSSKCRFSISKRTKPSGMVPLLELKDQIFSEVFGEVGVKLRIVLKRGRARIELHGSAVSCQERVSRFLYKLKSRQPLKIGSLFSGGGILDSAIHRGLKESGIDSYLKVFVEQEQKYVNSLISNQPELLKDDSIAVVGSIEDLEYRRHDDSIFIEVALLGLPCTGASRAGITSNKIAAAEFHQTAGALFFYALEFIKMTRPAIVLIENVVEYLQTGSMAVIRSVLKHLNYDLQDRVFNGLEFGSLENRNRMVMVAISEGLEGFSLEGVTPVKSKPAKVADVLEQIDPEDPSWRTYDYLAAKEIRDKADLKGFRRALLDGSESMVPVIRRLYSKGGSTDPFILHSDGKRSRKFTVREHALIKGVPLKLILGLAETVGHEILGQSVCYPVFQAIGCFLGRWINGLEMEDCAITA